MHTPAIAYSPGVQGKRLMHVPSTNSHLPLLTMRNTPAAERIAVPAVEQSTCRSPLCGSRESRISRGARPISRSTSSQQQLQQDGNSVAATTGIRVRQRCARNQCQAPALGLHVHNSSPAAPRCSRNAETSSRRMACAKAMPRCCVIASRLCSRDGPALAFCGIKSTSRAHL